MVTRRMGTVLILLLSTLILGLGTTGCQAQTSTPAYPTKGIDLIIAFGAGGAADIAARLTAPYLSKKWGQPINVVNLPGASGMTGTKRMMDAPPDGYTMEMDNHATNAMQAAATVSLPYKWDDRTMIARVSIEPVFYMVKSDAPWKSLKEVMDYAKSKPGALKWGSAGVSGIGAFAVALLFQAAGVNVPDTNQALFESGAACLTELAGGHIDLASQQLSEIPSLVQAGKIRALAVVMPERLKQYPDVPTLKEAGYNFDMLGWQGVAGPPKLPAYIVQKWADGIQEASKDQAFIEEAAKQNKIISYMGPEEFTKFTQEEYKKYLPVAENMGIRK